MMQRLALPKPAAAVVAARAAGVAVGEAAASVARLPMRSQSRLVTPSHSRGPACSKRSIALIPQPAARCGSSQVPLTDQPVIDQPAARLTIPLGDSRWGCWRGLLLKGVSPACRAEAHFWDGSSGCPPSSWTATNPRSSAPTRAVFVDGSSAKSTGRPASCCVRIR